MFSKFILVVACISTSFLFMTNDLSYEYAIFCLSTHQLMDIRVVSTVWISWVALLWTFLYKLCKYVFLVLILGYIPRSGIDRYYGNSMFSFLRNCQTNCGFYSFKWLEKNFFKERDLLINGDYMKFEFHHLWCFYPHSFVEVFMAAFVLQWKLTCDYMALKA